MREVPEPDVVSEVVDNVEEVDEAPDVVVKRILLWNTYHRLKAYNFGLGQQPFVNHRCRVNQCETTEDRDLISTSHAVIFHIPTLNMTDVALAASLRPSPRQIWVFFSMESPQWHPPDFSQFDDQFNLTWTYRRDSDLARHYSSGLVRTWRRVKDYQTGTIRRHYARYDPDVDYSEGKNRFAVWLVSHCKTAGGREQYVAAVQKALTDMGSRTVDIIGRCATDPALRDGCPRLTCDFENDIARRYKFYFSFENAICRDYVTEKFFKALQYFIVPVVYGGADYSRFAPRSAYIAARDFPSPAHLAAHLHYLCHVCEALHRDVARTWTNLSTWWAGPGVCSPPLPVNEHRDQQGDGVEV